ncbi:MAG: aspartate carbamoyltransferase [Nanoarchaeota archaeon]
MVERLRLEHVLEAQQFSLDMLGDLFSMADNMRDHPRLLAKALEGRIVATLFYEPSTRTRLSFESAMLRLGGQVISTENAKEFSSAIKGESIEDTARVIAGYADAIVMRHHEEGAANLAASVSPVPIINAGDGKGQHPTQALLDVYTIHRELGRVEGVKVAMVGDLASGRTVRSLSYLLGKFKEVDITFVSPEHLRMRDDIKEYLSRHGTTYWESDDFAQVLPRMDVVYMTRIQKERLSPQEYAAAKGRFVIDQGNLGLVRPDARVLHPLPHVEEIDLPLSVEQHDPRIAYFRQSQNGVFVRMALLYSLLAD